ncbi:MAG TPA: hypothetical protein VLF68_00095 [Candidatus Saccharimonadales bacterium]|nr:hypothetical protein [Candidatus Saccharimonadales bacterium]
METLIDVAAHIIISLAAAYLLWFTIGKQKKKTLVPALIVALIFGLFIDVDHLVDYFVAYGFHISLSDFWLTNMFRINQKMFVPFHAFEYTAILAIVAYMVRNKTKKLYFAVAAVTMFLHLWTDIFLFSVPIQLYFITYRILTNFHAAVK